MTSNAPLVTDFPPPVALNENVPDTPAVVRVGSVIVPAVLVGVTHELLPTLIWASGESGSPDDGVPARLLALTNIRIAEGGG